MTAHKKNTYKKQNLHNKGSKPSFSTSSRDSESDFNNNPKPWSMKWILIVILIYIIIFNLTLLFKK